ncbi:MAG TPA: hypothetical protein VNA04_02740 [Thermoanaerobaculia bacterium]|nr:hypothetical protein [Thermoanaerobaculia bacterium]
MTHRLLILVTFLIGAPAAAETLHLRGFLTGRAGHATGPESWMEGGFGRLDFSETAAMAIAEVGLDWNPSPYFGVHLHGVARAEPESFRGRRAGLVAGFVELRNTSEQNRIQLRAGQFFLPTSRENKGDLWSSPYTVSFSALNTWMGQEVRPVGLDLEWRHTTAGFNALTIGATLFQGNDTMGTLLAWRGWSVGNRLPVFDELAPLPPLWSLPIFIPDQNPDGTTPFRNDLDGRTGWSARARLAYTDRAVLQVTHVDNRGDYLLYGDEYAWKTKFTAVGGEVGSSDGTVVAAEWLRGFTGMGPYLDFLAGRPVMVGFEAAYVLLSHKRGRHRFSGRIDAFSLDDRDNGAEDSTEDGASWTLAWLYELTPRIRTAVEFTQITGDSNLAAESGFSPNTDARSVIVEVRYSF